MRPKTLVERRALETAPWGVLCCRGRQPRCVPLLRSVCPHTHTHTHTPVFALLLSEGCLLSARGARASPLVKKMRSAGGGTTASNYNSRVPTGRDPGYSHRQQHQSGPYPMHSFSGPPSTAPPGNSAREIGSTGGFLHPGDGVGSEAARHLGGGMGVMSASSSPPPPAPLSSSRREGYPDVAVARQCEREGCNVQPSYGKVWKKVSVDGPPTPAAGHVLVVWVVYTRVRARFFSCACAPFAFVFTPLSN